MTRAFSNRSYPWQAWLRDGQSRLSSLAGASTSRRRRGRLKLSRLKLSKRARIGAIALPLGMILWQLDWQLWLATLSGIGTILLITQLQRQNWQKLLNVVVAAQKFLAHPLFLAMAAGAIASLGTYVATGIWKESPNSWLGMGLVLEGVILAAAVALLGLLVWQRQEQQHLNQFDQCLTDLSDPDPLRRLVALRQLSRLSLGTADSQMVQEALYLFLGTESEDLVRRAALEELHRLDQQQRRSPLEAH